MLRILNITRDGLSWVKGSSLLNGHKLFLLLFVIVLLLISIIELDSGKQRVQCTI